jgi:hypothetical protein
LTAISPINLALSSNPDDHVPIIRSKRLQLTESTSTDAWSVGCICGFFTDGGTRRFIASEHSAKAIYYDHLVNAGVVIPIRDIVDNDDIELEGNTE